MAHGTHRLIRERTLKLSVVSAVRKVHTSCWGLRGGGLTLGLKKQESTFQSEGYLKTQ